MKILQNGNMVFEDVYELTYELFNEMELSVRPDGSVVDNNTGNVLAFHGNMIKATINPLDVKYAGQGEIVLDLLNDVKMVTDLFGLHLIRKQNEGMSFVSYFQEEYEQEDIKYTALTVKFDSASSITSGYFHNRCLKFIHMIFALEDEQVDLRNFDLLEGA